MIGIPIVVKLTALNASYVTRKMTNCRHKSVLTATFNSYGDRQISTPPPTKLIPMNQSTKNSAQLFMSARGPTIPNLVQIRPVGDSGQMGEI